MMVLLVVGAGGFLGAVARYWLSGVVQARWDTFPAGTLAVNVLGCLLIGFISSLVEGRQWFSPSARAFIEIGILGSLTTFSTMSYEVVELLRDGQARMAVLNIAANVLLGVSAVLFGRLVAKLLGGA